MLWYKSKNEIISDLNWRVSSLERSAEFRNERIGHLLQEIANLHKERNDLLVKLAVFESKKPKGKE